jgi:hypothetical protein
MGNNFVRAATCVAFLTPQLFFAAVAPGSLDESFELEDEPFASITGVSSAARAILF